MSRLYRIVLQHAKNGQIVKHSDLLSVEGRRPRLEVFDFSYDQKGENTGVIHTGACLCKSLLNKHILRDKVRVQLLKSSIDVSRLLWNALGNIFPKPRKK